MIQNHDQEHDPTASDLAGQLLAERYHVLEQIGDGSTGTVYKAEHIALGRICALKVLRDTAAADTGLAARFRREARAASRLDHPNIVYISDFGRTPDGRLYLVMEYIEGPTLRDVVAGGPLPRGRAFNVLRQVATALDAAHEAGVIHRDIKPENIVLQRGEDGQDNVKILDFSLAKIFDESDMTALTHKGDLFGTPAYMSPEQVRSDPVTPRTDLYAFGALAYEVLTGHLPFERPSIPAMMLAHREETPPHLTQRLPPGAKKLPDDLVNLVMQCLEKDPAARPARGRDVVQVLDTLWEAERAPTSALTAELSSAAGAPVPLAVSPRSAVATARRTWAREQTAHTALSLVLKLRQGATPSPQLDRLMRRVEVLAGQVAHLENDAAILHSQHGEQQRQARTRQARLRYAVAELSYERGLLAEQPDASPQKLEDFDFQIAELESALKDALGDAEGLADRAHMSLQELREKEANLRDAQRAAARALVQFLTAHPASLPDSPEVRLEFDDLTALLRLAE